MTQYDNNRQLEVNDKEEVLVTNVAIKTTDVLLTVAAGALAIAGIGAVINQSRKGKRLKEQQDFEARIISNLIAEGASEAEIENARKILSKI